jgi:hypothetical protein
MHIHYCFTIGAQQSWIVSLRHSFQSHARITHLRRFCFQFHGMHLDCIGSITTTSSDRAWPGKDIVLLSNLGEFLFSGN